MYIAVIILILAIVFTAGMTVGLKIYKSRFDELYELARKHNAGGCVELKKPNPKWGEICTVHIAELQKGGER